jgi:peptide/nickel transport system substrate-binding protein
MNNRFTVKDFVLFALVVVIGLGVFLSMVQRDRLWDQTLRMQGEIKSLSTQVSGLQRTIESRPVERPAPANQPQVGKSPAAAAPTSTGPRDESWARPGVPISWTRDEIVFTDPRKDQQFSEGGEITIIFEGRPAVITPFRYGDTYGRYVNDEVTETLGRYNPQSLRLEHALAEAWQLDPEGLWLRVKIRPNARFSDGQDVTAEDVKFTYHDFIWNSEIQADRFRGQYNVIKTVEVLGAKVLEFQFKSSRYDNLSQSLTMPIVPKHYYGALTPAQINSSTGLLMGSGPYRMERLDRQDEWTPPDDIVLVRNENYWGPRPPIDKIRFKIISDSKARFTSFTNGEADVARPTTPQFDSVRDDTTFNRTSRALKWFNVQGGWSFIAWQNGLRSGQRTTPFSDARVRRAMTHLIDRERIVRDIYNGLARVAHGPFSSVTPMAAPDVKPLPYDPAEAKRLLTEAGWIDRNNDGVLEDADGRRFTFQLTYSTGNETTTQLVTYVKDQCAKFGIICELDPIDWSLTQSRLDRRDFDAITFAWSASVPEPNPTQLWSIASIEGTGDNFAQWRNEKADGLIKSTQIILDDTKRFAGWHQFHRAWHEDQPYTPIAELPWLRLVSRRVGNFQTYNSGIKVPEFFLIGGGEVKQP